MDHAVIGEVRTGLLRHSTEVTPELAARLLTTTTGATVWQSRRPIPTTISPDRLTGVDCALPGPSGATNRVIGTVACRLRLTGGRVLQGSACATVGRGHERRQPWAHYLARPGHLESMRAPAHDDLADGFLRPPPVPATREVPASTLDLGAIAGRAMDGIDTLDGLDRRPPFRIRRTVLRWVLTGGADATEVALDIQDGGERTLRLRVPGTTPAGAELVADAVAVAETVALHDWLVTAQQELIDRGVTRAGSALDLADRLNPAVNLLHLWMPDARPAQTLAEVWGALDRAAGMTLQWRTSERRIRDLLALGTLALLSRQSDIPGRGPAGGAIDGVADG